MTSEEPLRYAPLPKLDIPSAIEIFRSNDLEQIVTAIFAIGFYGLDADFALPWCTHFLNHRDNSVARAAALSIGYLARVHRRINRDVAVPMLEMAIAEGRITEDAKDALWDVNTYCPPQ